MNHGRLHHPTSPQSVYLARDRVAPSSPTQSYGSYASSFGISQRAPYEHSRHHPSYPSDTPLRAPSQSLPNRDFEPPSYAPIGPPYSGHARPKLPIVGSMASPYPNTYDSERHTPLPPPPLPRLEKHLGDPGPYPTHSTPDARGHYDHRREGSAVLASPTASTIPSRTLPPIVAFEPPAFKTTPELQGHHWSLPSASDAQAGPRVEPAEVHVNGDSHPSTNQQSLSPERNSRVLRDRSGQRAAA